MDRQDKPEHEAQRAVRDEYGFWEGYWLWLATKRAVLMIGLVVVVLLFLLGCWLIETPQDPFTYELF